MILDKEQYHLCGICKHQKVWMEYGKLFIDCDKACVPHRGQAKCGILECNNYNPLWSEI